MFEPSPHHRLPSAPVTRLVPPLGIGNDVSEEATSATATGGATTLASPPTSNAPMRARVLKRYRTTMWGVSLSSTIALNVGGRHLLCNGLTQRSSAAPAEITSPGSASGAC